MSAEMLWPLFVVCAVLLVIFVPLSLFMGMVGDLKLISRDIQAIRMFVENPPPIEMRTSFDPRHSHDEKPKAPPYTGENYL